MSTHPKTAPYGSWQSPITSDLIVTQSISLSEVRFDGQAVYWLEARPQEEGRNVVVRAGGAGHLRLTSCQSRSTCAPARTNMVAAHGQSRSASSIFRISRMAGCTGLAPGRVSRHR